MAAWRYEISLLVLKKIYFTSERSERVKYFSTLEEKFRISARPCNILYLSPEYSFRIIYLLLGKGPFHRTRILEKDVYPISIHVPDLTNQRNFLNQWTGHVNKTIILSFLCSKTLLVQFQKNLTAPIICVDTDAV